MASNGMPPDNGMQRTALRAAGQTERQIHDTVAAAAPPRTPGVWLTRTAMGVSLVAYTLYFDSRYGLSFDQPGMDSLWPIVWIETLAVLVVAHLPAWFLTRKIAIDPAHTARRYVTSTALLYTVAISGVVIQGTDWDELALFLIPTLPTILAVTILTVSRSRHDRHGIRDAGAADG